MRKAMVKFKIMSLPVLLAVGSTNVTNVTTHAVVFSQQQTSQHHHQHQRQTSNNDKRHRVFYIRTTNVTMSQCLEL